MEFVVNCRKFDVAMFIMVVYIQKSENYRTVSLTSVVSKLLEKLIRDHMLELRVKYQIINKSQHGFFLARSYIPICYVSWKKLQSG